ncbi:hypothetical protein KIN20_029457 [Parelaphostrongylus tenuis]|uniref:Uncharacterized protein n=1 Tax=Parelaphostrongylus tenuis TaxID=148309 RepID=A0AAD5R2T1_PARTN|nr:hypothetical protein KIN20_029457 [Parelaphostrongylus tenuis]
MSQDERNPHADPCQRIMMERANVVQISELSPDQQGTPTPRPSRFAPKAMLIISGTEVSRLIGACCKPVRQSNAGRYCQQMDRCNQAVQGKEGAKLGRGRKLEGVGGRGRRKRGGGK